MTAVKLGETIKAAREAAGLTQMQLAVLAQISQGYLSQVEVGDVENIGSRHLSSLADALGLTVYQLLGKEKIDLADGLNPLLVNQLKKLGMPGQQKVLELLEYLQR